MAIGLIMAGVSIGSSIFSAIRASKEQKKAARKERRARREMNRLKQVYANMDITNPFTDLKNPYENMENMMEDLKISSKRFLTRTIRQTLMPKIFGTNID